MPADAAAAPRARAADQHVVDAPSRRPTSRPPTAPRRTATAGRGGRCSRPAGPARPRARPACAPPGTARRRARSTGSPRSARPSTLFSDRSVEAIASALASWWRSREEPRGHVQPEAGQRLRARLAQLRRRGLTGRRASGSRPRTAPARARHPGGPARRRPRAGSRTRSLGRCPRRPRTDRPRGSRSRGSRFNSRLSLSWAPSGGGSGSGSPSSRASTAGATFVSTCRALHRAALEVHLGADAVGLDPGHLDARAAAPRPPPNAIPGQRLGQRAHPAHRHVPVARAVADHVVEEAAVLAQRLVVEPREGADQRVGGDDPALEVVLEVARRAPPPAAARPAPPRPRRRRPAPAAPRARRNGWVSVGKTASATRVVIASNSAFSGAPVRTSRPEPSMRGEYDETERRRSSVVSPSSERIDRGSSETR